MKFVMHDVKEKEQETLKYFELLRHLITHYA